MGVRSRLLIAFRWAITCGDPVAIIRPRARRRENGIIRFARWLAFMEKTASMLSVLSFVWATAVILGGYASDLKPLDFCFVSIILVIEGAGILGQRHDLRWLRRHSSDNSDDDDPLRLSPGSKLRSLQFYLNLVSYSLSLRIFKHDYHRSDNGGTGNLRLALDGFYGLVLAQSVTLTVQMVYFHKGVDMIRQMSSSTRSERSAISDRSTEHITISVRSERDGDSNGEAMTGTQLLRDSNGEANDLALFYNSYAKCMEAETFDVMRTDHDLTCYAVELLLSRSLKEQLWGATILCNFLTDREDYTQEMRRRYLLSILENSSETLVKLIEMLRWEQKNSVHNFEIKKELRRVATNILLQFVTEDHHQNAHRLASLPGCLDSILTLLEDESIPAADRLNLKGLQLLEAITQKDDTRDNIGNTPALLSKIIEFTIPPKKITEFTAMDETIGLSLKVLLKLVQTEGPTGIRVRCNILENIYIASNLRSILRIQNNGFLNDAIDILMYLAMDNKEARDKIGRVGGITDRLLTLFLDDNNDRAGKTLYMLSLEHRDNCNSIAESTREVMEKLLNTLRHPNPNEANNDNEHKIIVYSANILRNIFAYGSPNVSELRNNDYSVLQAVVNGIKMTTDELLLESYLGLMVEIYKVTKETSTLFDEQNLIKLLRKYEEPSIKVPYIRRYAIELANLMMKFNRGSIATFKSKELGEVLNSIRKTTSELESFYMFSGSIGLNSIKKTMHNLCRTTTSYLIQDIH